jgi:hypothetical protein
VFTGDVAAGQLSRVLGQAIVPAFLLTAIGTFIVVLLTRLNLVIERIRTLNQIPADDAVRGHLRSEVPRLRRRAAFLRAAALCAIGAALTIILLMLVGFIAAIGSFPNEVYAGVLFILACIQLGTSLILLGTEICLSLPPLEFYG